MRVSELINELVKSMAHGGDRDVMISVFDDGGYEIDSIASSSFTVYLRNPDPKVSPTKDTVYLRNPDPQSDATDASQRTVGTAGGES